MGDAKKPGAFGRALWAMAACVVVLLAWCFGFLAAQEEKIGGWGGAALRVQMNEESDKLLNGRIGPALVRTLAGRRFVPWEQSAVRINVVRTRIVLGALIKRVSDNELGALLTLSEKSSDARTNPYVLLTKNGGPESFEAQLAARIRNSKGGLAPQDVLAMSLDVCNHDYCLATLTAHNLLKEVAYADRSDQKALIGFDSKGGYATAIPSRDISRKLIDLRPKDDAVFYDRMGPWYHAFGLFFAGGVASGTDAQIMGEIESLTRVFKAGSPPDYFKERINTWAGNLSPKLNAQVNRNIATNLPAAGPSPVSPTPPPAGKGYWKFSGERLVKGKPFLVSSADTTKVDASGSGSTLSTVCTSRNWKSVATFSWTATAPLDILRPGTTIEFSGLLTHSGDGRASAGVTLQPYGMEPGTGISSAEVVMHGFDNTCNSSKRRPGKLQVPQGPLYPDKRAELRFEIYPGCATSALYRTYEWTMEKEPKDAGKAAPETANWSGSWSSDFGRMSLQQRGIRVSGSYAFKDGRIEGTVRGNVMSGTWTQSNGSGSFEFKLNTDGRAFKGRWGNGNTLTGGEWNGSR